MKSDKRKKQLDDTAKRKLEIKASTVSGSKYAEKQRLKKIVEKQ
jgi:hypothetical protein